MAISLLGTVSKNTGTSGATLTISHTVTSGTKVLVVTYQECGNTSDTTTATATYNGVSMTSKVNRGVDLTGTGDGNAYIFYLTSPSAGTANVVVTCGDTTPNASCAQCSNWDGVDISGDPFEASNTATSTTGAPSVNVTTLTNNAVVIDSLMTQSGTITNDASQTLLEESENIGSLNLLSGGSSYELKATAGSTTMSWADMSGTDWIIVGAALKPGASAALTGTITPSATESDIVTGGKTLIITLTGDTWVTAGATFDAQRQNIINGIDSAQAEGTGWDAVVKAGQGVAGVVRTSDTVVTITWDAFASYDITATETITATIPSTALTGGVAIVATPTFTITAVGGTVVRDIIGAGFIPFAR